MSVLASTIDTAPKLDLRTALTRLVLLTVIVAAHLALSRAHASAEQTSDCPHDVALALQQARHSLESDDPAKDRAALTCLVEAVAALDSKLSQLMTGEIPFDGKAWLAKGWIITKPTPGAE
ncbi:MAG: hypothetical protein AB7U75_07195 [Hyphomicrobiaceae bacterium]